MIANGQWVAVEILTGKAVAEFYNPTLKQKLNTKKYRSIDILEYLQGLSVKSD